MTKRFQLKSEALQVLQLKMTPSVPQDHNFVQDDVEFPCSIKPQRVFNPADVCHENREERHLEMMALRTSLLQIPTTYTTRNMGKQQIQTHMCMLRLVRYTTLFLLHVPFFRTMHKPYNRARTIAASRPRHDVQSASSKPDAPCNQKAPPWHRTMLAKQLAQKERLAGGFCMGFV